MSSLMEIILFTGTGILLYLATDVALKALERLHGEPLPYRNVIFFVIIFLLAMIAFPLVRTLLGSGPNGTS